MKTSQNTANIFSTTVYKTNHLFKCLKNGLREFYLLWQWFSLQSQSLRQQTLLTIRQYVTLGWIAGSEVYANDRKFSGLITGLVGLSFWWAHLFFDYTTVIPGWYYKNFFFWFFTNREELTIGFGLIGFFLICPVKWGYKYALVPLIVFMLSEVIYQSFQISHWTHFYISMFSWDRAWQLLLLVPVLIFSGVKVLDYAAYRKYHQKDGDVARIIGIIKAPGIPVEKKMDIMEKLVAESENFNNRI
jgi:hypothetical protein